MQVTTISLEVAVSAESRPIHAPTSGQDQRLDPANISQLVAVSLRPYLLQRLVELALCHCQTVSEICAGCN